MLSRNPTCSTAGIHSLPAGDSEKKKTNNLKPHSKEQSANHHCTIPNQLWQKPYMFWVSTTLIAVREVGGHDEDSPATIYLFWLSWLHSKRFKFFGNLPEMEKGNKGINKGCWSAVLHVAALTKVPHRPLCWSTLRTGMSYKFRPDLDPLLVKFRSKAEYSMTYLVILKWANYVIKYFK